MTMFLIVANTHDLKGVKLSRILNANLNKE
jgi:hypothetical protein